MYAYIHIYIYIHICIYIHTCMYTIYTYIYVLYTHISALYVYFHIYVYFSVSDDKYLILTISISGSHDNANTHEFRCIYIKQNFVLMIALSADTHMYATYTRLYSYTHIYKCIHRCIRTHMYSTMYSMGWLRSVGSIKC